MKYEEFCEETIIAHLKCLDDYLVIQVSKDLDKAEMEKYKKCLKYCNKITMLLADKFDCFLKNPEQTNKLLKGE